MVYYYIDQGLPNCGAAPVLWDQIPCGVFDLRSIRQMQECLHSRAWLIVCGNKSASERGEGV